MTLRPAKYWVRNYIHTGLPG